MAFLNFTEPKIILKGIFLFLMAFITVEKAHCQQDPLLTQYMFNTQLINPAYTGIWDRSGINSLVRKQWVGISQSPLTEMVSVFTPLKNEAIAVGISVIADQFGLEKKLGIFGDYAYQIDLNRELKLRLGLKFGFMNYQNPLTQYINKLYPDRVYDPVYTEDIELRFLPNFGFGAFLYTNDYYVSFSVPKIINNSFGPNYNNFSNLSEIRSFYLTGGYVFKLNQFLHFKPTAMIRATIGAPIQFDLGANFLILDKLWVGPMLRSGDALCAIVQWVFNNNLRIGFGMDFSFSDIYRYQMGTYEMTLSYDLNYFSRSFMKAKYF
jgi:type IX secretion system PorP/SprF family membrane protein